jgi:Mor family transcriptional regulator
MSPLSERNDEIYRRWRAGENYIDLAREYDRHEMGIQTMLRNRSRKEARKDIPPGPSNKQLRELNRSRDLRIVEARKRGETYRQIGKEHGLCLERVRQIVLKEQREKWKRNRKQEP